MEFLQGFWEAIHTGNLPDLGNWSYVLIALLVFLEGPSVTLVAGTMAATGILRAEWVFVAAVIGNFSADQFWYWLGQLGSRGGRIYRLRWFQNRKTEIEQLRLAPCTVEDMLLSIESGLLTLKRRFIFLHPSWKKERPNHPGKDRSYVSVYDSAKGHLFIMRKTGKTNGAPHDHLLPPIQFVARSA